MIQYQLTFQKDTFHFFVFQNPLKVYIKPQNNGEFGNYYEAKVSWNQFLTDLFTKWLITHQTTNPHPIKIHFSILKRKIIHDYHMEGEIPSLSDDESDESEINPHSESVDSNSQENDAEASDRIADGLPATDTSNEGVIDHEKNTMERRNSRNGENQPCNQRKSVNSLESNQETRPENVKDDSYGRLRKEVREYFIHHDFVWPLSKKDIIVMNVSFQGQYFNKEYQIRFCPTEGIEELDLETLVSCPMGKFGCLWTGNKYEFQKIHQSNCSFLKVRSVLERMESELKTLKTKDRSNEVRINNLTWQNAQLIQMNEKLLRTMERMTTKAGT